MSNLILPKKSAIWLPDRQLVLPDRTIVPPRPEFMGALAAGKKRGKTAGSGGGGGGLLLASDWATRSGAVDESDGALRDTTKGTPWSLVYSNTGTPAVLGVVSAAGRGFPAAMSNCLRCQASTDDGFLKMVNAWPTPDVGTSIYYRMYYRCEFTDAAGFQDGSNHHPVQADDNGTWNFHVGNNIDGTFRLYIHWDTVLQNWVCNGSTTSLSKNTTYRVEWKVTRATSTTNSMAIRVYGSDDATLLFPNSGNTLFVGDGGSASLEAWGAGFNGGRTGPGSGIDSLALMELGCNGGPALANQPQYQYYGGVMVRNDTWCGPY
jgi:hypothetical protein